ncbi:PREDICTED: farnesol dehydrogenase-like [Dinoponera quadriceps]|uniref:Farnesol dehydrogenase-like n=1 Tax=Dinoponera quadriceps TaxID=609295 RepID=A0A6P3XEM8_DINQU|nr:PREDICTED: farnesol dehydrogenase-like [Dinoponera quadriceps]
MERWAGKVALVTGASAGIGAQITKMLAQNGMKVIAAARRLEKLEELAAYIKREYKVEIYPITCDVRKEEDILKVFKWANDKLGGVDVLVNNAGVLWNETIIDGSTEHYRAIMEVNVIGTAICSRELTRSIKKREACGHIININSIAGHYAESLNLPLSVYCASKYGITGMTHNLRNEISNAKLNIRVTSISPGAVDTYMLSCIEFPEDVTKRDDVGMLKDQDIADAVLYVLGAPPHVVISELIITPHGLTMGSALKKQQN